MRDRIFRVLGGVLGTLFVLGAVPIASSGPDNLWPSWVHLVTFFGVGAYLLHYAFTGSSRIFRARTYDAENEFIEQVISDLRGRTAEQLRSLPRQSDLEGPQEYADTKYYRWVDALKDGGARVVIQAYQKRWLGTGRMAATGFDMHADGSISELGEPEIFEYL